jgi:hypothetical protein
MSDERTGYVKISMVGPSRVGKTSLITSILDNTQELLRGMPVSLNPAGRQTEKRIHDHRNEMRGSINAGEFNPGGLGGTQEPFYFEFDLGVGEHVIRMGFLDFPGGWLNERAEQHEEAWHECRNWFRESQALIVPTDASVLMEWTLKKHKSAVPTLLAISEVEHVAIEWAKARNSDGQSPAVLVIAPVKCEAYFDDNGGRSNRSNELFSTVQQTYRQVIDAVKAEFNRGSSQLQIVYAPVDTFGCVEFMKAHWREDEAPGGFEFSADYRLRDNEQIRILGAKDIMSAICRNVLAEETQLIRATQEMLEHDKESLEKIQKDRGILKMLAEFFTGTGRERSRVIKELGKELGKAGEAAAEIKEALDRMASRPTGPRAQIM